MENKLSSVHPVYNIFVASSLTLVSQRKAMIDLVEMLNTEEISNRNKARFSVFEYEHSDILQVYDAIDAQAPIEQKFQNSLFFVLICDGVVGSKTVEEYQRAVRRFEQHRPPAYIYVFFKKNANTQTSEGYISYNEFEEKYNLRHRIDNNTYEAIAYKNVYAIPYNTAEDIKNKMAEEIDKWAQSDSSRPLIGSKLGGQMRPSDLYKDAHRISNCNDGLYYKRDFDDKISDAICECRDKFIYIYGTSLSGKTRALYHAMRKSEDMWFYVFPSHNDTDALNKSLNDVAAYLRSCTLTQRLNLVFDDFDKYDFDKLDKGFNNLIEALNASCNKGDLLYQLIFTASEPLNKVLPPVINSDDVKTIRIAPMDEKELAGACSFFTLHDKKIFTTNKTYRTTGALLIDIMQLKNQYRVFLKKDTNKRVMLLKAIKGISMWRRNSLGDKAILREFCKYLCGEDNGMDHIMWNNAIADLCQKCAGVAEHGLNHNFLIIEEYIYKYFISNEGGILEADASGDDSYSLESEKKLVDQIMDYVYQKDIEKLANTVGKIAKRCDHQQEIGEYLFNIWNGNIDGNNLKPWMKALQEEKQKVESGEINEDSPLFEAYNRLVRTYIYRSNNFDQALELYSEAKVHGELMMAALISMSETDDDMQKIKSLPDFNTLSQRPLVMSRMAVKATTFDKAVDWIRNYDMPLANDYAEAKEKVERKDADRDEYLDVVNRVGWFKQAVRRALCLVTNEEQFDQIIGILKANSYAFIVGEDNICAVCNRVVDTEVLTMFDLLSEFNYYTISSCFNSIFGDDVDKMRQWMRDRIIPDASKSCESGITPKFAIRRIGEFIVNTMLVSMLKKISYDDALNKIFIPAQFNYVDQNGVSRVMKFWNSYAYSTILRYDQCDYWKADALLKVYLEPQSRDNDNLIFVTRYILNSCIKLSFNVNSQQLCKQAFAKFEEFGTARDVYAYNEMLQRTDYKTGLTYLRDMLEHGLAPDDFTLTSLLESTPNVNTPDVSTVIAYLPLPNAVLDQMYSEVRMPLLFDGDMHTIELLKKMGIKDVRKYIGLQPYSWQLPFLKKCRNRKEAQMLRYLLEYIEKEKPSVLADGIIYNNYLKNELLLPTDRDLVGFLDRINSLKLAKPDIYTYNSIFVSFKRNGRYKGFLTTLNGMFKQAYANTGYSTFVANWRLTFFDDYTKRELCVLPNEDNPLMFNALEYIQELANRKYKLNSDTVRNFCSIERRGITNADNGEETANNVRFALTPERLSMVVKAVESTGGELDSEMAVKILHDYYYLRKWNHDDLQKKVKEIVGKAPVYERNKFLVESFRRSASIDYQSVLQNIDTTYSLSAAISFNSIVSSYLKKVRQTNTDELRHPSFFNNIWTCYLSMFKDKTRPTSETFGVLLSMVQPCTDETRSDLEQVKTIYGELKRCGIGYVTSHYLTNSFRLSRSYGDLKLIYDLYTSVGGRQNKQAISPLFATTCRLAAYDDTCFNMAIDLACYIIPPANDTAIDKYNTYVDHHAQQFSCLLSIKDKEAIDIHVIKALAKFKCYVKKIEDSKWNVSWDYFFETLFRRYPYLCLYNQNGSGVLEFLLPEITSDSNKNKYLAINRHMYPRIFAAAAESNPNIIVGRTFLLDMISKVRKWSEYSSIVEACRCMEYGQFYLLAPMLYDCLWKLWHQGHITPSEHDMAKTVWQRVSCYAPMTGRLCYGHFMPDTEPSACTGSTWLNTIVILSVDMFNKRLATQERDLDKRIRDAAAVPDSYYVALWMLANIGKSKACFFVNKHGTYIPTALYLRLREYEDAYVGNFCKYTRNQRQLLMFPVFWETIGYVPQPAIVLSILRRHIDSIRNGKDDSPVAKAIIKGISLWLRQWVRDNRWMPNVKFPIKLLNKNIESNIYVMIPRKELEEILKESKR